MANERVNFRAQRAAIVSAHDKLKMEENARHSATVSVLADRLTLALKEIENTCLRVNGQHRDDGGMFYGQCADCGAFGS